MRQLAKEASTSNTLIPNRKEEAKEDSKEEEEVPETNSEKLEAEEKEERSLERKEETKKQVEFFLLQYVFFLF